VSPTGRVEAVGSTATDRWTGTLVPAHLLQAPLPALRRRRGGGGSPPRRQHRNEATTGLLRGYYESYYEATTRLLRGYYAATTRLLPGHYQATTRLLRIYLSILIPATNRSLRSRSLNNSGSSPRSTFARGPTNQNPTIVRADGSNCPQLRWCVLG
jgi:hypothetical protein